MEKPEFKTRAANWSRLPLRTLGSKDPTPVGSICVLARVAKRRCLGESPVNAGRRLRRWNCTNIGPS